MPRKDPCSELARTITDLAMAHGEHPDVKTLDDVVARMQKDIPEIGRAEVVQSIIDATTGYRDAATELEKKLADLRREARNDKAVREAVVGMQTHLKAGTQPGRAPRKPAPEAIRKVRQELAGLRKQVTEASPARRQKVQRRIEQIERAIATGEQVPARPRPAAPADLVALRAKRDDLRGQMKAMDPAKRAAVRAQIAELNGHLEAGTVPRPDARPEPPADLADLRRRRDELRAKVAQTDPLKRVELHLRIKELQTAIDTKQYPAKAGGEPDVPPDVARLRGERDTLLTELERLNPQRIEDAKAKIAELEGHLKAGTLPTPKDKPASNDPADLVALRDSAENLRAAIAKSDPALRKKFEEQIEALTERLENGVSLPEPKGTPAPMSRELERLKFQRDRLKAEVRARIEDMRPLSIWDRAADVANLQRIVMLNFDLPPVFRQGAYLTVTHPIRASVALARGLRAMMPEAVARKAGITGAVGDEYAYQRQKELMARDIAPLADAAGLYLAHDLNAAPHKQEEQFMTRLLRKVSAETPAGHLRNAVTEGLTISGRGMNVYLNELRMDAFEALASSLPRNNAATLAEAKQLARHVNMTSGRGELKAFGKDFDQAGPFLTTLALAPRWVASRFQVLGSPVRLAAMTGKTPHAQKVIAKDLAKFMGGMTVVLGLAALASDRYSLDPADPNFLKFQHGDTTIDLTAGLGPTLSFLYRVASGRRVTQAGKNVDLRGEKKDYGQSVGNEIGRFARSKAAPLVGAALDLANGEDVMGQPVDPLDVALDLITPINIPAVYSALREHGFNPGAIFALFNQLGASMNTFDRPDARDRRIAELENEQRDGNKSGDAELRRLRSQKRKDRQTTRP